MSRTSKMSRAATDRFSNLPGNVIGDILKHLLLRDAVRTSILSKQWRYKWITIPCLVFDEEFKEKLQAKYNIESIVNQVLLIHKGPIIKFEFTIDYGLVNYRPVVDYWLHFLANHCIDSIEGLTFSFRYSTIHERMPHNLFSFDKLKHLWIYFCTLRPPSEFQGFGRLDTIDLMDVLIEPRELRSFISKCPMLRNLGLYNFKYNTFGDLEIVAPNLKTFRFSLWDRIPSICIKHTVLLKEVSLFSLKKSQGSQSNLIEFFGQLSSITTLDLDCNSLQLFARACVLRKFPSTFSNLTLLHLFLTDFGEIDHVSCVVCLIKSFPNLPSLEIDSKTRHDRDVKPAVEFLKEQQNSELTLCHLEMVRIGCFSGSEPEMEFVKLILSAASALVKLKLNCDLKDAANEESRMLKELARFRRASTKAEIIIS